MLIVKLKIFSIEKKKNYDFINYYFIYLFVKSNFQILFYSILQNSYYLLYFWSKFKKVIC